MRMDDRANIACAAENFGRVDIVIDEASHASYHQKKAFPEMFPHLPSGVLYEIEDLRWQKKVFERTGIAKTAKPLRGFAEVREFHHFDPGAQAAFRELAPDISGCYMFQAHCTKTRRDQVEMIHKR